MPDNSLPPSPPPKNLGDIPGIRSNASSNTSTTAQSDTAQSRVEIVKIPENLETQRHEKAVNVKGRVAHTDPQTHRATIRTNQGDIDIQLPKERPLPARGTQVELRLPPTPPQQPPGPTGINTGSAPPPRQMATLSPLTQASQSIPSKADHITLNTPLPATAKTYQALHMPPSQGQILSELQNGQPIRLLPLPPAQLPLLQIGQLPAHSTPHILNALLNTLTTLPTPQHAPTIASLLSTPAQIQNAPTTQILLHSFQSVQGTVHNSTLISPPSSQASVTHSLTLTPQALNNHTLISQSFVLTKAPPINIAHIQSSSPSAPLSITPHHVIPENIQATSVILKPSNAPLTIQNILTQSPQGIHNPAAHPSQILAHVIATTPQGQSVISIQSFTLNTPPSFFVLPNVHVAAGTILDLPAAHIYAPSTPPTQATLPTNINTLLTPDIWPALQETLEILQQANPQIAQMIANIIPSTRTPAQMTPAALLFIAAMKGGDVSAWMGERAIETLRRLGKSELVNRLGKDFSTLSRALNEPLGQDWRGFAIPLSGDAIPHNIAVFYRQEEKNSEQQEGQKQTRFIFDMDLSRMGSVQIDGLFHPHTSAKRLEIILRTEAPLSDGMKQMLRQNYQTALQQIQIAGELSFQSDKENFISIIEREEKLALMT